LFKVGEDVDAQAAEDAVRSIVRFLRDIDLSPRVFTRDSLELDDTSGKAPLSTVVLHAFFTSASKQVLVLSQEVLRLVTNIPRALLRLGVRDHEQVSLGILVRPQCLNATAKVVEVGPLEAAIRVLVDHGVLDGLHDGLPDDSLGCIEGYAGPLGDVFGGFSNDSLDIHARTTLP
jgi:hypothetical protein